MKTIILLIIKLKKIFTKKTRIKNLIVIWQVYYRNANKAKIILNSLQTTNMTFQSIILLLATPIHQLKEIVTMKNFRKNHSK